MVKSTYLDQRDLRDPQKGPPAAYPRCPPNSLGYPDLQNRLLPATLTVINFTVVLLNLKLIKILILLGTEAYLSTYNGWQGPNPRF